MGWLAGAAVVIAIIYFLIISPGLRAFAIGLLLLIAGVYFYASIKNDQEMKWSKTAINSTELQLTEVSLEGRYYKTATYAGANFYGAKLKGTITNNSKYDLKSIGFTVTIRDCPTAQNCKVIGQRSNKYETGYSWNPIVPAGQTRLFETNEMGFPNMPPASDLRWDYKITDIEASR